MLRLEAATLRAKVRHPRRRLRPRPKLRRKVARPETLRTPQDRRGNRRVEVPHARRFWHPHRRRHNSWRSLAKRGGAPRLLEVDSRGRLRVGRHWNRAEVCPPPRSPPPRPRGRGEAPIDPPPGPNRSHTPDGVCNGTLSRCTSRRQGATRGRERRSARARAHARPPPASACLKSERPRSTALSPGPPSIFARCQRGTPDETPTGNSNHPRADSPASFPSLAHAIGLIGVAVAVGLPGFCRWLFGDALCARIN